MTEAAEAGNPVIEEILLADDQQPNDQDTGTDAPAAAEGEGGEGEQPPAKPKQTAQERIDELTRARREAEREAEFWKSKATAPQQPEPAPAQPKAEEAPDPANYPYGEADTAFIRDLARYEVRQEFADQAQKQAVRTQVQTIEQQWEDRQTEFAKTKPDYQAVIARDWVCSPVMADAIKTSEEGAAVAYHLAQNPDEARRIAALPPIAQVRELGRIEAGLTQAPAKPPANPVSNAPPPAPQVRGAGGRFTVSADTEDFSAFERQHMPDA